VDKYGDEKKEVQKKAIVENHSEEVKKDPFEVTKKKSSCAVQNPFEATTKKKCKCCQHVSSSVGPTSNPVFRNTSSSNALAQGVDPLGMKQSSADVRRGMQWGSIAKIKANRKKAAKKEVNEVEELKDDDVDMEKGDDTCSTSSEQDVIEDLKDGDLKEENTPQHDLINSQRSGKQKANQ